MTDGFRISLHAQARRVERAIRDEHLAAALCASPTLHLADRTAHYYDAASGVVIVAYVPDRVVKTVFRVEPEGN